MATTAAAVAAAVARARREVRGYFEEHGAFDPAHAVQFDPPKRLHEKQLEQLIGRGIIKETMEGRYWFDREAYRLEQERRAAAAKQMMVVIAVVAALAVAAAAIIRFLH
jgi:hypothetical protein